MTMILESNRNPDGKHVLYVDVDETLMGVGGTRNVRLVECLKILKTSEPDTLIYVWSARGLGYAEMAVKFLGLGGVCDGCLPKPTHFMDDMGHSLFRYVKDATPANVRIRAAKRYGK